MSIDDAAGRLRAAGIPVTMQRVEIVRSFLSKPAHLTAEQIFVLARERLPGISRATIYNTLRQLCDHGLARELIVDGERSVYDSSTHPHHHYYDVETGRVWDVPQVDLARVEMPRVPPHLELLGVEMVIRVRHRQFS